MTSSPLPTQAGAATLAFSAEALLPMRQGNLIVLPKEDSLEFHPLKGGEQFLVFYPESRQRRPANVAAFGGTDEAAFVTAVAFRAVQAYWENGEEGFFDSLRPACITTLSSMYPDVTPQRQGDIWYFPLPMSWEELSSTHVPNELPNVHGSERKAMRRSVERQRNWGRAVGSARDHGVIGTRHTLYGDLFEPDYVFVNGTPLIGAHVGQGILSAPDHTDRDLMSGPHVISRTPHVIDEVPMMAAAPVALVGGD